MTLAETAVEDGPTVVHMAIPGRVRLRAPGLKGAEKLKRFLESALPDAALITDAQASAVTGNILVHYKPEAGLAAVLNRISALLARYKTGRVEAARPSAKPWHVMQAEHAMKLLRSSAAGLSAKAFQHRLRRYGENVLPSIPGRGRGEIFVEQFKSLPVALLLGAATLSLLTGGVADAVVVLSVVALNAGIGYATESHAERAIRSLARPAREPVAVLRDGKRELIPIERAVPGDLLELRPGVIVAADARIIEAQGLAINEATLTGESAPAQKTAQPLASEDAALADRANIAYRGTIVTGGSGRAVVVATGAATEIGQVQGLIGGARAPETPLQRQLSRLGRQLTFIAGGACGLVLVIGLMRGYGALATVKNAIALAVAAVPEGLPTLATTTLALGIEQMRRRHVLVRRLEAVETLACVRVACLDKTGTLTLNRMSVAEICCGGRSFRAEGPDVLDQHDVPARPEAEPELEKLAQIVALCNETATGAGGKPMMNGSATEAALLNFAFDLGIDVAALRRRYPLEEVVYRTEGRLFMTTLHRAPDDRLFAAVKGSPESVLGLCRFLMIGGEAVPLTRELRRFIEDENARLAHAGQRVLAAAFAERAAGDMPQPPEGLIFVGLIGLADPLRPGVVELLAGLRDAGVSPVMITGDQKDTAAAIARALNLGNGELRIVDSSELPSFSATPDLAGAPHVFARVTPGQKLEIVKALQRAGLVVAMTGDGVNDSPALKAADIGVAMGHGGSEAAREVASIVLEDDNLASLAPAIEQGRTTYGNIRRAIHYLLATNMSEILLMLAAPAANLGQPLTPAQLLWINLVTDVLPALALGLEPPHEDAMRAAPMEPHEDIIAMRGFRTLSREAGLMTAGALGAYVYGLRRYGQSPRARALCFASLIAAQLLHALSCRSRAHWGLSRKLPPNRALFLVLASSFALQAIAMSFSPIRRLLGVAPLGFADLLVALAGGVAPFLVNESLKRADEDAAASKSRGATEPGNSFARLEAAPLRTM